MAPRNYGDNKKLLAEVCHLSLQETILKRTVCHAFPLPLCIDHIQFLFHGRFQIHKHPSVFRKYLNLSVLVLLSLLFDCYDLKLFNAAGIWLARNLTIFFAANFRSCINCNGRFSAGNGNKELKLSFCIMLPKVSWNINIWYCVGFCLQNNKCGNKKFENKICYINEGFDQDLMKKGTVWHYVKNRRLSRRVNFEGQEPQKWEVLKIDSSVINS